MASHELVDFIKSATDEIGNEYERIQKRATEDPGTAGDQGEENWATLLRQWLPTFHVVTKGRILGDSGIASPQVDVIILLPEYPTHLLDKKLYLAGGVVAAFECKITLKASHIGEFFSNSVEVKGHSTKHTGTPYKELQSSIIYGLLAHSHSWKGERSMPVKKVSDTLIENDEKYIMHPIQLPDIVCIADLATWTAYKTTYIGPGLNVWNDSLAAMYGANGSVVSGFMCFSEDTQSLKQTTEFSPLGALITTLYQKLSWRFRNYGMFAQYFTLVNVQGSGQGNGRAWPTTIYTDAVKSKLGRGFPSNGQAYDEWSIAII